MEDYLSINQRNSASYTCMSCYLSNCWCSCNCKDIYRRTLPCIHYSCRQWL